MSNGWRSLPVRLRQPAWRTLRARLIVPYVLLTLLVAVVGTYIATRLAASDARERFNNQLYEAARVAADGVARRERAQLADLRLMVFADGVPEALRAGDAVTLQARLFPFVLNNNVQAVTALDRDGRERLTLVRRLDGGEGYLATQGADFAGFTPAARALRGETDAEGDKFVGFLTLQQGPYLFTAAPVRLPGEAGAPSGALLVGSNLVSLLADLRSQAYLTLLDLEGRLVATTFAEPEEGYQALELTAAARAAGDGAPTRSLLLNGRGFQAVDSPLVVRGQVVGWLSAALPADYVIQAETTSRNLIAAIFALLTLAVIILGYLLAQGIAWPLLRLRDRAQAVAAGDLQQSTGISRPDEIGDLAGAFDVMTQRLHERTQEAERLYAEANRRNQELAQAMAQLRAAQQQLIQSEKLSAVGQLTAGIVHDVKNPLAIIRGLAELREDDPDLDEANRTNLAIIRENVKRASRIVSDLMTFARQSEVEVLEGDLRATVETVLRLTNYMAREARVDVHPELPATAVIATYDPRLLEQVLVNLIQNAIQAMPQGGRLTVRVAQTGETATVAVQDTGTGIAPEVLGRIFDPFFTTKPAGQGTGLGLSVSYGIVARHGGQIEVDSAPGQGATFTIRLPLQPPPAGPNGGQA